MNKNDWLEKKKLRAVDQLRLWPDNPRLDPDEKHVSLSDYALDLLSENGEKNEFFKLIDSIVKNGFINADPIVVWQNDDNKNYYVGEGNRRVLALKLLRSPEKAPKSIRSYIRRKSTMIDRASIEKIKVCIAPSFEDSRWYINQRHSPSSLQHRWSRLQQQRWIAGLYDEFDGDIEQVAYETGLTVSELGFTLRILKIRDLALTPYLLELLTDSEKEKILSHRIPMTILERWFFDPRIREAWGINYDGDKVNITSNLNSFLRAYAYWLKLVIRKDDPEVEVKINTRTVPQDIDKILPKLPAVSFSEDNKDGGTEEEKPDASTPSCKPDVDDAKGGSNDENEPKQPQKPLSKNPDRNQLVVKSCKLNVSSNKLDALFKEFKILPIYKYKNTTAAALRVFLDLAIAEHISSEGYKDEIISEYNNRALKDISLKQRLEFIKRNKLDKRTPAFKVVEKLLNASNEHSLDTLNNYIHGTDQQHTNKRFLNGFWDFLYPLFEEILDMKEV